MKVLKAILFCLSCYCFSSQLRAQAIAVDDSKNASALVSLLTNNSSCLNISTENVSGDNFTPGKNSYGSFSNSSNNFPFQSGIVLSTWSSTESTGPFVRNQGGGSNSWLGDPDLNQALNINSINATVLEFDFTPFTNIISFNYFFASNEYQDYFPCKYSDGFAFLIKEKGSATAYQNLALIPNTAIPISSTNIHPAINFVDSFGTNTNCPATNQSYFGQFNNVANNTSPINYAGQTKVFNAKTTVIPGTTYHIKLVIGDDKVNYYDSAIFIEAASFNSVIDLGADKLLATNNAICFGQDYIIDTKLPSNYTFKWYKDNILLTSETNPSYTVKSTGTYKVEASLNPLSCKATQAIKIEYTPEIVLNNSSLIQCDSNGDGKAIFDLTKADSAIKNNNPNLSAVSYFENLAEAKANSNPILNRNNYTNKSANQILIAKVSNSYNCTNYAELTLQISNQVIPNQSPIITCDDNAVQDGFREFNLNNEVSPQLLSGLPNGLNVAYFLNLAEADAQTNAIPNLFTNTMPNQQIIYARIINGTDCYGITPITLKVNTFSPTNFQDETFALCSNSSIDIAVNTGFSSYLWNTDTTTNSISITTPGDYFVTVTNSNNCQATKNFHIVKSEIATITGTQITDFSGNNNSVTIEYTGTGNYEFSIDGNYYQDNPKFSYIASGIYFAYARDKNGCGISSPFRFYILDYPHYFTPNGDGYNDSWTINNLAQLPPTTVQIFNRYGKLLKQFNSPNFNWNGTLNNFLLPADDYWFSLIFEDGKNIKGHFSLKR
ncbi:MAG: choice-of-anchor L domain-containing protein [Bacteroidota bacterium]